MPRREELMTIMDRIDRTTRIPETHLRVDPPAPQSIKIEITGICNLRCGFCALTKRASQPTQPMDRLFLERILRESRDFGIKEVGLFYIGESFTAIDLLVWAIETSSHLGFENIFLTSNATISTPEKVKRCIEAGLTSLKWSVNNATPEQFAEVTARPERLFHMAIANIKAAKAVRDEVLARTGHRCELSMSSIKYDGEQMDRMEPLLAELRPYVDNAYQLPPYTMGGAPIPRELELGIVPTAGNQGRVGALVDPIPCWAGFTEAHVTSCGALSFCCFDADGNWTMADLRKTSLAEAWHSLAFQTLRAAHLKGDVRGTVCEKCALY